MAFPVPIFMKLVTVCLWCLISNKSNDKCGEYELSPTDGFHSVNFHETHNHSVSCVDISCTEFYPNRKNKVESSLVYAHKQSMAVTVPIFMKLVIII